MLVIVKTDLDAGFAAARAGLMTLRRFRHFIAQVFLYHILVYVYHDAK